MSVAVSSMYFMSST